ncbi:MAG: cytidylate kinase-like family protein [Oscillospiraceae bacterium]|nr:cytidylate kinase-like family protein [Oscillospiraceae bacterium]MBQ9929987.1 cytidylate kinase-like family protein [Oscillospiraceae bacterium]
MKKNIITISRQFGSGGRTVGRMVAEKLGIPFYDKELVEQISLESGFAPTFVEEHGEHAPGKTLFSYAFAPQGVPGVMNGMSTADFLWHIQCSTVIQLAEAGPCVIVGRNADYILKDRPDALHVYVHADMDQRADRIVRLYGESEKSPQARLQEKDKRRAVNYQHYTGRTWGAAENYDICLNTGKLGIEAAVETIVALAKE